MHAQERQRPRPVRSAIAALIAVLVVAAGLTVTTSTEPAEAADLSSFDAGNIISDEVFFDSSTMTESAIQSFLEAKVPSCKSGYTCLKGFRQSTTSRAADAMCNGYAGAANESAARIIYKVARSCGVNPQAILTMLQKEQGLVASSAPSSWAWKASMGYACPDTAACDTKYYGFYNQVFMGVWQLKRYGNPPGTSNYFTWYPIGKPSAVRYHPNAACGSGSVVVKNKATAALYYYTPYQPNAAALAAGYGSSSDKCSSYGNRNFFNYFNDWFGSSSADDPKGNLDQLSTAPGQIRIRGWAFDPSTPSAALAIHVYVGGTGSAHTANGNRPDIGAAYPSAGGAHGFDITIAPPRTGRQPVCVYAINVGSGSNKLLGCSDLDMPAGPPLGSLDSMTGGTGTVTVAGWAIDPDTTAPIDVHVHIGSKVQTLTADQSRADIGRAHPAFGPNHGFSATFAVQPGTYNACVYGIDVGQGANVLLGCKTVTIAKPLPDLKRQPMGSVDAISGGEGVVTVRGWALDPDTTAAIAVHVYVGQRGHQLTANAQRTDIAKAYPAYGGGHGFTGSLPADPGTYDVCVYAINNGEGGHVTLACRSITVYPKIADQSRQPLGHLDAATTIAGSVSVRGWTIDPDTAAPIAVQVTVGGKSTRVVADVARTDIAKAHPLYGAAHGFSSTVPAPSGSQRVCVTALNDGPGGNVELGCSTVVVPPAITEQSRRPVGIVDGVTATTGGIEVRGWALDPDTSASIDVHVYVGSAVKTVTANVSRPDIARAFPGHGDLHGFTQKLTVGNGTYTVCIYAIDTKGAGSPSIGCRSVTVGNGVTEQRRAPIGALDRISVKPDVVSIAGWAIDPDTTSPIQVHAYIDDAGTALTANGNRPDIAKAYPVYGAAHGFSAEIPATKGSHRVCVYAINTGSGGHVTLGCSTVVVP